MIHYITILNHYFNFDLKCFVKNDTPFYAINLYAIFYMINMTVFMS